MSKNSFFITQSREEIDFFLNSKSFSKSINIIPIDLEALVYCDICKLNFINPKFLISDNFQKSTLIQSERYFSKKSKNFNLESINKEINQYFRFRFNSISFINELINNLKKKYKIHKIYLSGDNIFFNARDKRNRILYSIIKSLFNNIKIEKLRNINIKKNNKIYSYTINNRIRSNFILFTNLGYNFKRIIKQILFRENIAVISNKSNKVIYENLSKISLIKAKLLNLIGIKSIELEEKKIIFKKKKIKKIKAFIGKKNITKILNLESNLIESYYNDIFEKYRCLKKFFKYSKPKFAISNVAAGYMGAILDAARENKSKIVNIPHGTLAPYYNKYDKIFKKNISEGVFYEKSDYFVCQTKITNEFLETEKFVGKILKGNIILGAENNKKKYSKQILYAVANKSFHNQQLVGFENFYEYYENLNFFNRDNFFRNYRFKIQLHPSIYHLKNLLEKKFRNLIFEKSNLEKNLSESFLVISFSSTVIEDAILSNSPVILYDRHNRYRHYKSKKFENLDILHYVVKKNVLKKKIHEIYTSSPKNYNEVVYDEAIKKNVSSLVEILKN